MKPWTELSAFPLRADVGLVLAMPNHIRHLILNLGYRCEPFPGAQPESGRVGEGIHCPDCAASPRIDPHLLFYTFSPNFRIFCGMRSCPRLLRGRNGNTEACRRGRCHQTLWSQSCSEWTASSPRVLWAVRSPALGPRTRRRQSCPCPTRLLVPNPAVLSLKSKLETGERLSAAVTP